MGAIRLINLRKDYGKENVIPNLNLDIVDGSFTVLVGPSGCGKSTTLRMIAGLEKPTGGQILIDGVDVANMAPGKRDLAMVFQNYALYPTMTVRRNIEFGLINKKVPKAKRDNLIDDVCEIVGLTPYLDRKPANLSGGQRQRVALARAMVKEPKVFLMDEPLSNLDAKLRASMRVELIELHKRLKTTFIYVTHDQTEAMSMGDVIVLMNKGVIQQMASPEVMYRDPNNLFTAQFIGSPAMNVLPLDASGKKFGFRPERALLSESKMENVAVTLCGEIVAREMLGSEIYYTIRNEAGQTFVSKQLEDDWTTGQKVYVGVVEKHVYFFAEDGNRVRSNDEAYPAYMAMLGAIQ